MADEVHSNLKALVLGLDHTIQEKDNEGRLKSIVCKLCDEHAFDLIAEEWETGKDKDIPTVGRKFAAERSIAWLNIDIGDRVRKKLGIYDDLNLRRYPSNFDENGPVYKIQSHVYLLRADCFREQRWLKKITRHKRNNGVLVMCGHIHVQPFASKLRAASFDVATLSLCDHAWYRALPYNKCAEVKKGVIDERY